MFSALLVPLDGSPASHAALEPARWLARKHNGTIRLVRVCEGPEELGYQFEGALQQPYRDKERLRCENYLDNVCKQLQTEGIRAEKKVLDPGNAAARILEEVEDDETDLIVMSSHSRTGVNRAMLGSVAEKVARHAGCPVLIVGRQAVVAPANAGDSK